MIPIVEASKTRPRKVNGIAELHIPVEALDILVFATFKSGHYTVRGLPERLVMHIRAIHPPN